MSYCKEVTMKCRRMEKSSAAVATVDSKLPCLKASPVSPVPSPIKPQCSPATATTVFSLNTTRAVYNKENTSRNHDRSMDDGFEDSGYLSLQNSQIDDHHGEEGDEHTHGQITNALLQASTDSHQGKSKIPKKCKGKKSSSRPLPLPAVSPLESCHRRSETYSLSSTPSDHLTNTNLPILKFQKAVCEELAKSYRKNKKYDWSIISRVAEDHLLDRVIGVQMGCEHVDVFSSLLMRNMRHILKKILVLLGDMDLISCKKVSRTWKKIICEDTAALNRCQRAEQALRESRNSVRQQDCRLTRDVAVSRVVLSCMQKLASSSSPLSSSSTPSLRVNRRTAASLKTTTPTSQCTRFSEYVQAASSLKQHESLRTCRHCGSPATHFPEARRATCIRISCLFDFCTCCQEAFHGSTPCRVVQPRSRLPSSISTPLIPGSARSKRSIRRL